MMNTDSIEDQILEKDLASLSEGCDLMMKARSTPCKCQCKVHNDLSDASNAASRLKCEDDAKIRSEKRSTHCTHGVRVDKTISPKRLHMPLQEIRLYKDKKLEGFLINTLSY
jgi:hypothetical protein